MSTQRDDKVQFPLFRKRLAKIMEMRDLSILGLGTKSGTSGATISRYLAGKREPEEEI